MLELVLALALAGSDGPAAPVPPVAPTVPEAEVASPRKPSSAGEPESKVVPPSLTTGALVDELRRNARERKAELARLEKEREANARERVRLEKLAAEIERNRASQPSDSGRGDGSRKPASPELRSPPSEDSIPALAKTLRSMKPEHAAGVLERLDRKTAAHLLRKMRASDAAAVMDRMKAETAAELLIAMGAVPTEGKGATP